MAKNANKKENSFITKTEVFYVHVRILEHKRFTTKCFSSHVLLTDCNDYN